VPVVRALYLAVHKDYQGVGFGAELNLQFLRNLEESFMRPRYVFLEVFAENPAAAKFSRFGYVELEGRKLTPRGSDTEKDLVLMALDLDRDDSG
jgi:ribosomal protein S18 acetylase RimI-like enzyme